MISCFFMAEDNSIVCIQHVFSTHSCTHGPPGCFLVWLQWIAESLLLQRVSSAPDAAGPTLPPRVLRGQAPISTRKGCKFFLDNTRKPFRTFLFLIWPHPNSSVWVLLPSGKRGCERWWPLGSTPGGEPWSWHLLQVSGSPSRTCVTPCPSLVAYKVESPCPSPPQEASEGPTVPSSWSEPPSQGLTASWALHP